MEPDACVPVDGKEQTFSESPYFMSFTKNECHDHGDFQPLEQDAAVFKGVADGCWARQPTVSATHENKLYFLYRTME